MEGASPGRPGIYDFRTIMGSWAHGCTTHYRQYRAFPSLGVGKGQRWITADQAPPVSKPGTLGAVLDLKAERNSR